MKLIKNSFLGLLLSCILISWCSISINKQPEQKKDDTDIQKSITDQKNDGKITKGNQNTNINQFVEYENKKFNFKLNIPSKRTFQENSQWFDLKLNTPKNDDINENLWVKVQTLKKPETLEDFSQTTIEWLKNLYEDYNEIEKENIRINWIDGIQLIYEISENWYKIKSQQTTLIKDNKSYIFQYTATKESFEMYINDINNIIKSFTILN